MESTRADAAGAVAESSATRAQAQRAVDAASEQLESATREVAEQLRAAEARAAGLADERDALKAAVASERAGGAAAQEAAEARRAAEAAAVAALTLERDAAREERQRAHAELEALRRRVVAEQDVSGDREASLARTMQTLQTDLSASTAACTRAEAARAAAEARADGAELSLAAAQRRASEQSAALANLQALLEQLQLQAGGGPGEEPAQLRLGGRLLAREVALLEEAWSEAGRAARELPATREALVAAEREQERLRDESANAHALLRAANSSRAEDSAIDKRLVASILAKYFEREQSDEVLTVLASMLACTEAEQQVMGLLPNAPHGAPPAADARLSDMWIVRARPAIRTLRTARHRGTPLRLDRCVLRPATVPSGLSDGRGGWRARHQVGTRAQRLDSRLRRPVPCLQPEDEGAADPWDGHRRADLDPRHAAGRPAAGRPEECNGHGTTALPRAACPLANNLGRNTFFVFPD